MIWKNHKYKQKQVAVRLLVSASTETKVSTPATLIHKESDGFVLAESAQELPGKQMVIRMTESGHFQMRNDGQLEDVFIDLFLLGTYGDFYKLGN